MIHTCGHLDLSWKAAKFFSSQQLIGVKVPHLIPNARAKYAVIYMNLKVRGIR